MAEVIKYAMVAVVAFVIGGFVGGFLLSATRERGASLASSKSDANTGETIQEFGVEGMTCQGCVNTVTTALRSIPGVQAVKVSLAEKRAVVVGDPGEVTAKKVATAVADAGYKAKAISNDQDARETASSPGTGMEQASKH